MDDYSIRPYVAPSRLNSQSYHVFLEDVLPDLLEDVPLGVRRDMWFQHDGAPAHFGQQVRDYLTTTYGPRWIERSGWGGLLIFCGAA